ncbi:hypothetical protein O7627_36950 [Solwaraspora sp. WMMD1047]|uniref:hypothetical protein n=1 Tax=Solwaraspora sp. WMMD1047 TaxID=3016102 RepID=UPI0024161515|nr:hypothetical protein [Solwaraspora sp. WMMD1047]MDG4834860.1 hypothetical protein [Solwaraspora sp. WMMD1047]
MNRTIKLITLARISTLVLLTGAAPAPAATGDQPSNHDVAPLIVGGGDARQHYLCMTSARTHLPLHTGLSTTRPVLYAAVARKQ